MNSSMAVRQPCVLARGGEGLHARAEHTHSRGHGVATEEVGQLRLAPRRLHTFCLRFVGQNSRLRSSNTQGLHLNLYNTQPPPSERAIDERRLQQQRCSIVVCVPLYGSQHLGRPRKLSAQKRVPSFTTSQHHIPRAASVTEIMYVS